MAVPKRQVYRSENGDFWFLIAIPNLAALFVRHQPNLASGGQAADTEVGAFLTGGG